MVFISDLHCGSVYGLTPPQYFETKFPSRLAFQKESWKSYQNIVKKWHEPDVLIINGDCIEGRQERQGGAELITNDRNIQVDIAEECINEWHAKKILMTYGTEYHTSSSGEDFEYSLAQKLDAEIEGHLFVNIEGLTIDARHTIGTSGIPHGRATALLREVMWALIKEAENDWPKVDIVVRSHAHYHLWVEEPGKVAFITPALQLARGRFGSRKCSGTVHWGAVRLTLDKGKIIGKDIVCEKLVANKPKVIKIG